VWESHSRALSLLLTLGVEVRVDSRVEGIDGGERRAHSRQHKGRNGGREIPMHPELQSALVALRAARGEKVRPDLPVVYSERGRGYSAAAIAVWFHTRFAELRDRGSIVAFRAPNIHHQCGEKDRRSRRFAPRRSGTRRPHVARDHAAVHPGRHRGEAKCRQPDLNPTGFCRKDWEIGQGRKAKRSRNIPSLARPRHFAPVSEYTGHRV
jgi:hypothetical protein